MTLDVMIATFGSDGIARVGLMKLPRLDGVRYLVSWQTSCQGPVPLSLLRDDVTVLRHDDSGLSRNRNYALAHSTADICLVADDDLVYNESGLVAVKRAFEAVPDTDVALFRISGDGGVKWYPDTAYHIERRMRRGHYVSEVELAFRRKSVQGVIMFNELMGIGAPAIGSGEGDMFLYTALCHGMSCRYFPVTIAYHPGVSTGHRRVDTSGAVMGQGAMIYMYHRHTWPLRCAVNAVRAWLRGRSSFWTALSGMKNGALYARHFFRADGSVKEMMPPQPQSLSGR